MWITRLLPGQTRKKLRWLLLDDAVLVSFPKSGRTWVKSMLQDLGIPLILDHAGARRRGPVEKRRHLNKRVILLVRDPRDTVVSFYHHSKTRIPEKYPGTLSDFIREPDRGIERIAEFNLAWLSPDDQPAQFMLTEYERLRAATFEEMQRIASFAARNAVSEARLREAVARASFENLKRREAANGQNSALGRSLTPGAPEDPNSFKVRKGKVGGYVDDLLPADIAYCNEVLDRLGYAEALAAHRERLRGAARAGT